VFHGGGDPTPAGSAVLLWHQGARYLVTAAHILDALPPGKSAIGTLTKWALIPGPWRVTDAPRGNRDLDRFDIAFTKVTDQGAELLDGCEFLDSSMVGDENHVIYTGHQRSKYVFLGYPLNRFEYRRSIQGTATPYQPVASSILLPDKHSSLGVDASTHIACEFDRKSVFSKAGEHSAPKLTGMSGGGAFRYVPLEAPGRIGIPKLAGILVEHDPEGDALIATRIELVLRAIQAAG